MPSSRPTPPPPGAGPAGPPRPALALARLLGLGDRLFERIYTTRWNPLHQTGNLAILCFLVALATGLYLFLFYRIAEPHSSIVRIETTVWLGSWTRTLHRYAADLAMAATLLHLLRKVAQGHTWGPRVLAWVSGVLLLSLVLVCGWTGLVLVWDAQAQALAIEGARLLDVLPVLSEPVSRTFTGVAPVPSSFFFMNLFLHLALPLGLATLILIHVAKVARPRLLPPRGLTLGVLFVLAILAAVAPLKVGPRADLSRLTGSVDLDLFYSAWLPLAARLPAAAVLAGWVGGFIALGLLPLVWRRHQSINTSWVDENSCTGCTTCASDCPYGAISMVPRSVFERQTSELVALVDDSRCVGCGICAGSCAPMGVGPYGRTGRDQLAMTRALFDDRRLDGVRVVILGCRQALAERGATLLRPGVFLSEVSCAGSIHSSVIELLLRRGIAGVLIASCTERGCSFREGPRWLHQRLYHGREAELHDRVDRRRLAVVECAIGDLATVDRQLEALLEQVAALETRVEPELADLECQRAYESETERASDEVHHG